ncbi:MAG: type II CAAX endopeptidase family protein [Anaerolineae bacterium]|jgi:membrane protease YdiL (CAAX protease family)|nr:type II CAAX endopeptidase family protein [Anaerolineae bacterium]
MTSTEIDAPRNQGKIRSALAAIFRLSPRYSILSAFGIILGQTAIYLVLFIIRIIANALGEGIAMISGSDQVVLVFWEIAKFMSYTLSVAVAMQIFVEGSLVDLGLKWDRQARLDWLAGFAISFLLVGIYFLVRLVAGEIRITGAAWQVAPPGFVIGNLIITFLIFAFVGWSEELLSRGFYLQVLSERLNPFWGVVISSAIFTYLHRFNTGFGIPYIIFLFAGGLFFAYAVRKTGQLWLAMGLHAGWDYFIVVIFIGEPINNLRIFRLLGLQEYHFSGLLDLAGILLLLLLGAALIRAYARRRAPAPPLPLSHSPSRFT